MVFFMLTEITLDVTMGIAWWIIRNTAYSTYCLGCYLLNNEQQTPTTEYIELQQQITNLQTKIDEYAKLVAHSHDIQKYHANENNGSIMIDNSPQIDDTHEHVTDNKIDNLYEII